jgi:hypothetical protein
VGSGDEHGPREPANASLGGRTCQLGSSKRTPPPLPLPGPPLGRPPYVSRSGILSPAPSRLPAVAAAMAAAPPLSKAEYLKRYLSGADAGVDGTPEASRKRRKKRPKPGGAGGKG